MSMQPKPKGPGSAPAGRANGASETKSGDGDAAAGHQPKTTGRDSSGLPSTMRDRLASASLSNRAASASIPAAASPAVQSDVPMDVLCNGALSYVAPLSKPLPPGIADNSDITANHSVCYLLTHANHLDELGNGNKCSICLDQIGSSDDSPVGLKACGHAFHLSCIRGCMQHGSLKCPVCGKMPVVDEEQRLVFLRGDMPSGTMSTRQSSYISCAGYEGCGSIIIDYSIPSSVQKDYHPNPGISHGSANRTAYLPNNREGQDLMCRLQVAFLCGLTFRVGTSLSTNAANSVTWGSIHHKTSHFRGSHSYPDEGYLSNCNAELDALNVPSSAVCAGYLHKRRRQMAVARSTSSNRRRYAGEVNFFYEQSTQKLFDLPSVLKKIESAEFIEFALQSQLISPSVEVNPDVLASDMYQNFMKEAAKCRDEGNPNDGGDYNIQVVFHGTAERNIEHILCNGLDPSKRQGQAYGAGEYFASNPSLPITYCKGGKKMLVFAAITSKSDICTKDIVVVEKSCRQLPIATVSFTDLSHLGWQGARDYQARVARLLGEKNEKENIAKEARSKEKIIRLLLSGEYLAASDIYNKMCDKNGWPPKSWAHEVSVYVWDHIRDEEEVDIYFPKIPRRPKKANAVETLNHEKCEADAAEAKRKYEELANGGQFSSQTYPLDGGWTVRFNGNAPFATKNLTIITISVQNHQFVMKGVSCQIVMDDQHRPHFTWPAPIGVGSSVKLTATKTIEPSSKPAVGETLEWTAPNSDDGKIVWTRLY